MEARAVAKYVRMSTRKARLVIDAIRGKNVNDALRIVRLSSKKAALPIRKTLESAIANAENNFDIDVDELYVVKATADMGRSLRRLRPRAYGRADIIRRPTSHITIVVGDRESE
ncbi:50S ribosomal protein L22 [Candidatus Bipolaricaulota bacterium]|jgi:large subunit ribosomal protein L22|nr:50S ribosomal protein L22 [Candidatus Bipolaricaulota bacterium]TFH11685.1 MAG: 50S ribosomal protein L22 [Candidatus Atribacteria bacterium]